MFPQTNISPAFVEVAEKAASPSVIQGPVTQAFQEQQTHLSYAVLAFGALIILAEIGLMWKLAKGWGPASSRIVGITLIVTAGLFLITAGYSSTQIAPMMGLLGTIAGYLLGKSDSEK